MDVSLVACTFIRTVVFVIPCSVTCLPEAHPEAHPHQTNESILLKNPTFVLFLHEKIHRKSQCPKQTNMEVIVNIMNRSLFQIFEFPKGCFIQYVSMTHYLRTRPHKIVGAMVIYYYSHIADE